MEAQQHIVTFNQVISGDSLAVLETLPAHCVDLVFADPPYNLQLPKDLWRPNHTHVDGVDDAWDQFDDFAAYDAFTRAWLTRVRRVMKDTATIWISGTYHNIFRVGTLLQDLGFWVLNTIAWHKPNAMPNFRGRRLKNDIEFVIWAKYAPKSSYTFHHHLMKQFNQGKQLGSVWTIPACGGAERLKDAQGKKLHPTQKPEELLRRVLLASSSVGDLVLDPFLGSGTTAAVAKQLHRRWLGIDRDPLYVEAARRRVEQIVPLDADDPLIRQTAQDKPSRVPFRALLEQHLLHPGQQLYLDAPQITATVLENGQIQSNGFAGSIHRVAAQLKGTPSCNGWTHWWFDDPHSGERRPLDVLRQQVRER